MRNSSAGHGKRQILADIRRHQGWSYLLWFCIRWLALPWWRRWPSVCRRRFRYDGREYPYRLERYRVTWLNERSIEIPLALEQLRGHHPSAVLEVGNVLRHYVSSPHRVVDKYERAVGVENIDVLEISPENRYPLILSISTLEHAGWDEFPRDPDKAAAAIQHLQRCLAPGGRLFFTVPLGWNPPLDQALTGARLGLTRIDCLVRTGEREWRQVPWGTQGTRRYGAPFPWANAIVIGIYDAGRS
jgi:SAM-dependent methyltransferase